MDHEDAFVQAVVEDPDDDAPRLVFADWLDDHGDAPRAAFVRAQCRLARAGPDDPARPHLLRDQAAYLPVATAALRDGARRGWLGRIPDWAIGRLTYERGFPACVVAEAERFATAGGQLVAAAPVQHARLLGAESQARALASCDALARLRELHLGGDPPRGRDFDELITSPRLAGLRHFGWYFSTLSAAAMAALAGSPSLANLRRLTLFASGLGSDGLAALATGPPLNLEWLDLSNCPMTPRAGEVYARATAFGRLTRLGITGLDEGAAALASGDGLPALERLDAAFEPFCAAGVRALLAAGLPKLSRLTLTCDGWDRATWAVEPAAGLAGGVSLTVRGDGAADGAAGSPLLAACRSLGLSRCGDDQAARLAASPAVAGLRRLSLSRLGEAGVRALAASPHLAGLRELALCDAEASEDALAALLGAPFVAGLTILDLGGARLGGDWTALLAGCDALDALAMLIVGPLREGESKAALRERFGGRLRCRV